MKRKLSDSEKFLLEIGALGGLSNDALAKAFKVSRATARKARSYRTRGRSSGVRLHAHRLGIKPSELERRIARQYRHGAGLAYLAGKYNTSYAVIRRILVKHDTQSRAARRPSSVETFRRIFLGKAVSVDLIDVDQVWNKVRNAESV